MRVGRGCAGTPHSPCRRGTRKYTSAPRYGAGGGHPCRDCRFKVCAAVVGGAGAEEFEGETEFDRICVTMRVW
eukprot:gene10514-14923_t